MKILHLEDNAGDADLVREILTAEFPTCAITVVDTRDQFVASLTANPAPDIVISDFSLPAFDGLAALAIARERLPGIPFVFLSGSIGEERAIAAVRAGAYDYVLKDNTVRLAVVIHRALDDFAQRRHHKEGERRLVELAGIIERATEAIVVSDMTGRITLWNRGAELLYGLSSKEAIGRSAEEVFPPEDHAHVRSAREATLEAGEWERELNVTTRDGRNLIVDFRMTLVRDAAGRPNARLSIATDITEKKKLEEQLLRTQRLESLGLLAAGIAHDLNNVLAPMGMAAALLKLRATDPGDARILGVVEASVERGAGLVRQIVGFARGASGGSQLMQVRHIIRDLAEIIRASFPKSIAFEECVPGNLWPIQGNPTQIHQILLNLAVNARDAMLPRGGTLRLRAENQLLDDAAALAIPEGRAGAFLVLEVTDTGTGISPEVLARIWDPFFTTKGEGKGSGLGLTTVRGIAAAHGGFLSLDTQVGRGTTFRVWLPADQQAVEQGAAAVAPLLPGGQGELILVADDEANVREVAAAILTRHGYRVITGRDGVEALGLFNERSAEIRAVITDINMPKIDGPALAQVLHRLRPELRILAMSGLGSIGSSPAGDHAKFAARIQKPFTIETLLTALRQILRDEQPA